MMNEKAWLEFFSKTQLQWIEENKIDLLVKDYIKHNPKKTNFKKVEAKN